MSGGSYDYLCYKMEDAAAKLTSKSQPTYRRAFGDLMKKCAKAMHDIEWVDSCDKGPGDDEASIMECVTHQCVLKCLVEEAETTLKELRKCIDLAKVKK